MTPRYFRATLTYFQLPQHHTPASSRTHPRELKDTPTRPQGHTHATSRTHLREQGHTRANSSQQPHQNRTIPPPCKNITKIHNFATFFTNPLRTAAQKPCSTTFSINTSPLAPPSEPLIHSLISPYENRQSPPRRICYPPPRPPSPP